jgi:hypothetical protein
MAVRLIASKAGALAGRAQKEDPGLPRAGVDAQYGRSLRLPDMERANSREPFIENEVPLK